MIVRKNLFLFFFSVMLWVRCASAAPAFALEVIWLECTPWPMATGRQAHPPTATALLSHGSPAQLCRVLPPAFTAFPLAIRTPPAA